MCQRRFQSPEKVPRVSLPIVPLITLYCYHSCHPSQQTQGCVGYSCLEIHTSFLHFPLAESPWALPLVADGPVPLAKVLMAELAKVQLEDKPWPRGKALPTCGRRDRLEGARSPQPAGGHVTVWEPGGLSWGWGTARVGDTEARASGGAPGPEAWLGLSQLQFFLSHACLSFRIGKE